MHVTIAAALTTVAAIAVAQLQVYLLYPAHAVQAGLRIAPFITLITAFPFCLFVWSQVRKNYHLSEELQRLVDRDRLTDVATRDFFFGQIANNQQSSGVSLMVDIDRFKKINDTYGHLTGDMVIAAVARGLRENTRDADIVCRFGGEEFVVFLHEQGRSDGFETAERMRNAIADTVIEYEGQRVSVTVSIGGSLKDQEGDITQAIQQADQALYLAKSEGRNQTVFYGGPQPPNLAAA